MLDRGDTRQFVLELPRSEVGKVIGKQGHTINAIRNLLSIAAARQGGRVTFEIEERAEKPDELRQTGRRSGTMLEIDVLTLFPALCEGRLLPA